MGWVKLPYGTVVVIFQPPWARHPRRSPQARGPEGWPAPAPAAPPRNSPRTWGWWRPARLPTPRPARATKASRAPWVEGKIDGYTLSNNKY